MSKLSRAANTLDPADPQYLAHQFRLEFYATPGPEDASRYQEAMRESPARSHRTRWRFCDDSLKRLDRLATAPEADLTQIHVARATVRVHLYQLDAGRSSPEKIESLLSQALVDARASALDSVIFQALLSLGHHYRETDDFRQAEWHYKQALAHARAVYSNFRAPTVLFWLGTLYAEHEESLALAVYMFDWGARFIPEGLDSLYEKQRCRLKLGERDQLIAELKVGDDASPRQIAEAIAAARALGRRNKRIMALAQQGVLASGADTPWRRHFEWVQSQFSVNQVDSAR